jgi:hypothetical protein
MSTTEQTELPSVAEPAPLPPAPTAHPPLPNGLGTYGALTGVAGAVVAFVIAWVQDGLTAETVTLGAAAAGILAAWYGGRSIQAKAAIDKTISAYQEHVDLGDVGGVPPDYEPPPEGTDAAPVAEKPIEG